MIVHILAALLSGITIDVLATLVFHYTDKNKSIRAATINAAMHACELFFFIDVSKDNKIAIPYLIGIWIGGIIGVKIKVYLENRI